MYYSKSLYKYQKSAGQTMNKSKLILLAYYNLLYGSRELACEIIGELKRVYEKYPYSFDIDEECVLKVLNTIITSFENRDKALRELESIKCYTWSEVLRLILIAHINPSREILREIRRKLNTLEQEIIIEEEIAEAYNLIHTIDEYTVTFLRKEYEKLREIHGL